MAVWAIADLHLSFGIPDKSMDVFGEKWINHANKIQENWKSLISEEDLVLIAGDISWAMRLEDAKADLDWIHQLPGCKVMIKGNHDYWWESLKKIGTILPSSIHIIQNNVFNWKQYSIGGARLWDTPEYSFGKFIKYVPNDRVKTEKEDPKETERIFQRDLVRLEMSLKCLNPSAEKRLVMTHYPPISSDLQPSQASALLEKYKTNVCVFGHIHNIDPETHLFGERNGVKYYLTACDYLNFKPIKICD